jgi:hypothetical protein
MCVQLEGKGRGLDPLVRDGSLSRGALLPSIAVSTSVLSALFTLSTWHSMD